MHNHYRVPRGLLGQCRRWLAFGVAGTLAALGLALVPAGGASAATTVANPGFENDGTGTQSPTGWRTRSFSGAAGASYTEVGGHTGGFQLTHWDPAAYRIETYQQLTGLANGWYTLSVNVRSSGGQNTATIGLRDCGGRAEHTDLPPTANGGWVRIVTPIRVTGHKCTISLYSDAHAGELGQLRRRHLRPRPHRPGDQGCRRVHPEEEPGPRRRVPRRHGRPGDALTILRSAGMNYARLKVWVNPADGYNNKAQVLAMARRIKRLGLELLIDFHYSDTWADPGKQTKPAAWAHSTSTQLRPRSTTTPTT